jgi:hypothetical protein
VEGQQCHDRCPRDNPLHNQIVTALPRRRKRKLRISGLAIRRFASNRHNGKKKKKKTLTLWSRPFILTPKVIGQDSRSHEPRRPFVLKSGGRQGEWFFVVLHGQDARDIWLLPM